MSQSDDAARVLRLRNLATRLEGSTVDDVVGSDGLAVQSVIALRDAADALERRSQAVGEDADDEHELVEALEYIDALETIIAGPAEERAHVGCCGGEASCPGAKILAALAARRGEAGNG